MVGTDVYLEWNKQAEEEKEVQVTGTGYTAANFSSRVADTRILLATCSAVIQYL
ncbi:hypothetical protein ANRL3_00925 [Anaerolineae bacterium]|nr:hypothetical protein ANRL3_00925 [Anaerolineae bacterium]